MLFRVPPSLIASSTLALAASGCLTDHNEFAEQPPPSLEAGASGQGGTPAARDAGRGARLDAAPSRETGAASPPPDGVRSLTLLHGVIDSPWIAFCLSPVHGGKVAAPGRPFPADGLGYGHSVALDGSGGFDLSTDGLLPYVVAAASADAVEGLDCAHLFDLATALALAAGAKDAGVAVRFPDAGSARPHPDAGAPHDAAVRADASAGPAGGARRDAATRLDASIADGAPRDGGPDGTMVSDASLPIPAVRVAPLPLIPEGTFSVARGYLLLAGGCLGGPGVADPSQLSVCGDLYSPSTPTLTEIVVAEPNGAPDGHVSLSVLGGSPALTQFDVELVPGLHGDPLTVAERVVPGALRPVPPYSAESAAAIGATSSDSAVELFAFGSGTPSYTGSWATTFDAGGLTALEDGKSYTLAFIGPFPGFAKNRWWNDPLVTIVENR